MFIVASLHYRAGSRSVFGWTMMMCEWDHPVATLPSDEGDYTSLSLNDVNSANHRPGHEPTMPCFVSNHLAHQQALAGAAAAGGARAALARGDGSRGPMRAY
eukprot:385443-Pleurochrysis_carterae.AAC.2